MIRTSISEAIAKSAVAKTWEHDRSGTIGASEIGQCLRRTWFAKNEIPTDDGHVETRGAAERGDLIERYHWAPRLAAGLPPQLDLLWSSEEQQTIVHDYVSATPDGLVVNVSDKPAVFSGVDLPPGACVLVECKSIDPRVQLDGAKAEHRFQAQMQIGLVNECTNFKPVAAIVSYTNASFLDDVREFIVPGDMKIYEAGKGRAMRIMTAKAAATLPPEGYIAGGKECENCPFATRCGQMSVDRVPGAKQPIAEEHAARLAELANTYLLHKQVADDSEKKQKQTAEEIKQLLAAAHTRKGKAGGFTFSWATSDGQRKLDRDKLQTDLDTLGLDLSKYEIAGKPYDRLTVSRARETSRPKGNSKQEKAA